MARTRLAIGGTAAAIAAAVILVGGTLRGERGTERRAISADAAAARLEDGFAVGETVSLVARLERTADDAKSLTLLGLAYQQRAREAGDPAYYAPAERALRRALGLDPDNAGALRALAGLAATRHRFGEALRIAIRARRIEPHNAAVHGIIGDANLELGRYRAAFRAFEHQMALKPSVSAYARVSYARELIGDTDGAIAAMALAVDAAESTREPAAWSRVQLGNLHLGRGRLVRAERSYIEALALTPLYAPGHAALAQVETARGRPGRAAARYRRALSLAPVPEYAVGLGDVLAQEGDHAGARRAWARAEDLERRFAAAGGRNQLETALFDLDHGRDATRALARARAGYRLRPSTEGAHVLARALLKNGRCAEAQRYSVAALRLGTLDAGALYDRARIESCLGNDAVSARFDARVRAADPYGLDLPFDAR